MIVMAYGDDERKRRARELGAFTKPVDLDFLEIQLRDLVRRRGLTSPGAASNGRFQTIPGAHAKVGFGASGAVLTAEAERRLRVD
jgi:hypothetical protein